MHMVWLHLQKFNDRENPPTILRVWVVVTLGDWKEHKGGLLGPFGEKLPSFYTFDTYTFCLLTSKTRSLDSFVYSRKSWRESQLLTNEHVRLGLQPRPQPRLWFKWTWDGESRLTGLTVVSLTSLITCGLPRVHSPIHEAETVITERVVVRIKGGNSSKTVKH